MILHRMYNSKINLSIIALSFLLGGAYIILPLITDYSYIVLKMVNYFYDDGILCVFYSLCFGA